VRPRQGLSITLRTTDATQITMYSVAQLASWMPHTAHFSLARPPLPFHPSRRALQCVYEILLRFVLSHEVDPKKAKALVKESFIMSVRPLSPSTEALPSCFADYL